MIGSHNTFTYLKSTSWLYNNCKKYWKCQCKSIEEQHIFGIRMFDIRIYRDKGKWKPCHGKANLKGKQWSSIEEILIYMKNNFPDSIYRLWLEKGNSSDEQHFMDEVTDAVKKFFYSKTPFMLWRAGVKRTKEWKHGFFNQNQKLYDMGYKFALKDTWEIPCYELHGSIDDVDDFLHTDLRKEAKKINSKLYFFDNLKELLKMINSKDELYFLDYCTNEY